MRSSTSCAVFAVVAGLAGCNQDEPAVAAFPEGLKVVWGEMFAPYGLYPLFPVRTGIQPGDVFVQCKRPPALQERIGEAMRKAGADVASRPQTDGAEYEWRQLFALPGVPVAMAAHAKTRMKYHSFTVSTSASAPAGAAAGTVPFAVGDEGSIVGFASFPSVLSYVQKRTDAGIGAAIGVAALGAGASRSMFSNYLLEIPAAEQASLPHASLQEALSTAVNEPSAAIKLTMAAVVQAFKSQECRPGSLSVVGDVYYTRRITVTMADSQANALSARVAYQLPADSTRAAIFQALGSYAAGASSPAAAASTPTTSDNARFAKLMLDIDSVYKAADDNSKLGFTGVKVGFAKSNGKGVSMDYSYAHPVAFGVRLYALDMAEGEATLNPGLRLAGSLLPAGEVPLDGGLSPKAKPGAVPNSPPK